MTEWSLIRWHGAPEAMEAALRTLGWYGPGEEASRPLDPRIGGLIPSPGERLRQVDGIAYAAAVASDPLDLPPGLAETGPELSILLIGSF
jgi:hypothetical protein